MAEGKTRSFYHSVVLLMATYQSMRCGKNSLRLIALMSALDRDQLFRALGAGSCIVRCCLKRLQKSKLQVPYKYEQSISREPQLT